MSNSNDEKPRQGNASAANQRRMFLQTICLAASGIPAASSAAAEAASPDVQSTLRALLDRNHELKPDFGGGYSNHVSMGLYSLTALGGTSESLVRFAEAQWSHLEPLPRADEPRVTSENWRAWLGQSQALNGYRTLFTTELQRLGRAGTLRKYLPGLLPGVAAAAFHALIRTGYGVRFGDDREIADGLSYWATAYLPLGPIGKAGAESQVSALLAKLRDGSQRGGELPGRIIGDKMKAAARQPQFHAAVDALRPSDSTLASIAAAAVRLYLPSGDFTLLHAVTGTHAYRQIEPYIEPREEGIRYFWQAISAAYVGAGAPPLLTAPPGDPVPWARTLERALPSLEAHDLKLVDIAREEGAFYRDPIYQRAAGRRMRLLS